MTGVERNRRRLPGAVKRDMLNLGVDPEEWPTFEIAKRSQKPKVQWLHSATIAHKIEAMPTIANFAQSKIAMYAADHLPPHFHVLMNDGREALVVIASLQVLRGSIPVRELAAPLAWAAANASALQQKWKDLNP